jgi:hypothetical protein
VAKFKAAFGYSDSPNDSGFQLIAKAWIFLRQFFQNGCQESRYFFQFSSALKQIKHIFNSRKSTVYKFRPLYADKKSICGVTLHREPYSFRRMCSFQLAVIQQLHSRTSAQYWLNRTQLRFGSISEIRRWQLRNCLNSDFQVIYVIEVMSLLIGYRGKVPLIVLAGKTL